MNRRILLGIGAMFFFLASVMNGLNAQQDKQEGKDKKEPSYYPLQVGNQWTFKVSVGDNAATALSRIAKVENIDGVEMARLEAVVNGNIVATEHLRETEQGVFRYRNNGAEISPPIKLLQYPVTIKPKEPMKWTGKITVGADKGSYTCEATEDTVEVPHGKHKAIKVTIKLEQGKNPPVNTTYWFVKDLGFVKQTVDAAGLSILMELEKLERGKEAPK